MSGLENKGIESAIYSSEKIQLQPVVNNLIKLKFFAGIFIYLSRIWRIKNYCKSGRKVMGFNSYDIKLKSGGLLKSVCGDGQD